MSNMHTPTHSHTDTHRGNNHTFSEPLLVAGDQLSARVRESPERAGPVRTRGVEWVAGLWWDGGTWS